jgi:hypothetical protein
MKKRQIPFYSFSEEARKMLDQLSSMMGVGRSAVVEIAIRDKAREFGILNDVPPTFYQTTPSYRIIHEGPTVNIGSDTTGSPLPIPSSRITCGDENK